MGDKLRVAVGVIGNVATMSLYIAPISTFTRVVRKRSVEEFSCVPYIIALSNCFLYSWYGMPVVSCGWENFSIVPINGIGVLLELSFIIIFLHFAADSGKKKVALLTTPVIVVCCSAAVLSAFAFHDHPHRKIFVGSFGLVASASMYSSPMVAVKQVIKTKSVEFMPFYLSFFSFLASSLWLAYGLLSHDLILAAPNMVGCPVGIFQLMLYFKYRKRGITQSQQSNCPDLEKNINDDQIYKQQRLFDNFEKDEKPNQHKLLVGTPDNSN